MVTKQFNEDLESFIDGYIQWEHNRKHPSLTFYEYVDLLIKKRKR